MSQLYSIDMLRLSRVFLVHMLDSNSQLTEDVRKQRQEAEHIRDRASKGNVDLNDAFRQVQRLEEAMEAEMNTQNNAQFCSELIQVVIYTLFYNFMVFKFEVSHARKAFES